MLPRIGGPPGPVHVPQLSVRYEVIFFLSSEEHLEEDAEILST